MAEYMDKAQFLASMGLTGDETKYGNRDAEHQHRSYSTYMSYEIMDCVEDSIVEEELATVRHGRWDDSGRYQFPSGAKAIRCSICGCALNESEYRLFNWNYCPVCGARMDGDGNG